MVTEFAMVIGVDFIAIELYVTGFDAEGEVWDNGIKALEVSKIRSSGSIRSEDFTGGCSKSGANTDDPMEGCLRGILRVSVIEDGEDGQEDEYGYDRE